MAARLTVRDLLDQRGRHQFAMLRVETLDEAAAAEQAGVELLSVPPAMIMERRFREVAPNAFAFPGDNFYEIGDTADFLRWAFPLFRHGADAFYCSGSLQTVRAMADNGLPVCGHVGLIPSKRTWTGGFKAVGKTLETAKLVYAQCKALEAAGAFAAEIEVVPHSITDAIAEKTGLFLISMGAGPGGHAQYLFSDDVLGQTTGHVPRHATPNAMRILQPNTRACRTCGSARCATLPTTCTRATIRRRNTWSRATPMSWPNSAIGWSSKTDGGLRAEVSIIG